MSRAVGPTAAAGGNGDHRYLARINRKYRDRPPQELLCWALAHFWPEICLATSFGPQTIVLMHMISQIRRDATVFYLDTGLLFRETYALRDRLEERLGLKITRVEPRQSPDEQARQYGPALWSRDPALCCQLRKVVPLQRFLDEQRAWITGIRRGQTALRDQQDRIQWDAFHGLVKLNPLIDWRTAQIWSYLRAHDLPFNPLHLEGYPSIGCEPCTRRVRPGEDPRAGRWPGFEKTECGIHGQAPS